MDRGELSFDAPSEHTPLTYICKAGFPFLFRGSDNTLLKRRLFHRPSLPRRRCMSWLLLHSLSSKMQCLLQLRIVCLRQASPSIIQMGRLVSRDPTIILYF